MHLFWSQGYVATGVAQILEAADLKPGSFYNAFGSKKQLFVRTVEHYVAQVVDHRIETYLTGDDPVAGIEQFFLSACEQMPGRARTGCLLTNTALEVGRGDAEINKAVWAGLRKVQSAVKRRIVDAQEAGQVRGDLDPEAASLHLLSCFQGMSVIGASTQSRPKLRSLVRSALEVLH